MDELSAVRVALAEITRRLRTGELTPGQRLIASDLAKELNLSRIPVREALHVLAGEGVVDLQANRGARIRPIAHEDIIDMLRLLAALGRLAFMLAAEQMKNAKRRAEVRGSLLAVLEALRDRNALLFFAAADAFHQTVNAIADNSYLNMTYGHLHMDYFNRALASRLPGSDWPQFETSYRAIGRALLEGDAKEVVRLYEKHMQWAIQKLLAEGTVQAPRDARKYA